MSEKTKLFKHTPFHGYRREDVLEYIKAQDAKAKEQAELAQQKITDLEAELYDCRQLMKQMQDERDNAQEKLANAEINKAEMQKNINQLKEQLAHWEELSQKGFHCAQLEGNICFPVSVQAEKILSDARVKGEQILTQAKKEAEKILNIAEDKTSDIAEKVAQESHEMIANSVLEAKRILSGAKEKSETLLDSSNHSLRKIKERLTSMQFVLKNIESEIEAAKNNISKGGK